MPTKVEKDSVTGTETTGHEWDGIKELNTPLPKWWIIVFWTTVIFSVLYWVVYPTYPGWKGLLGYSSRTEIAEQMQAVQAERSKWLDQLAATPIDKVEDNKELFEFAQAGGHAAFAENCAGCHGSGAAGGPGYPNLLDDDWIWGGTLEQIQTTITHGIRWDKDEETRISDMPRFGVDEILDKSQINDVAEYVLSFTGRATDKPAAERGKELFAENCAACHGEEGQGTQELGAPRLNDSIWLYGGDKETIVHTITYARHGVMPAWGGRLSDATIKELTIYVHSLGGGQ